MAKKPGNLLIKLVVLLAVAGAVFFALDSWRKKASIGDDSTSESASSDELTAPSGPGLTREEAERIGTEIGTQIGMEVGTQIGREVAAQMLAERQTQQASSQPSEPVEQKPEPVAVAPAPEPEPAAPVTAEPETIEAEPAPAETHETPPAPKPRVERTQGTIPGIPVAQPAAGREIWWTKSNTGDANALALTYAGGLTSTDGNLKGIALMFSGRFDSQTDFASSISVSGGGDIAGQWQLGATQGLIYLPNVPTGSYTVTVKAGFTDADGKAFKNDLSGPVEVQ